jgi:hypothetical protein
VLAQRLDALLVAGELPNLKLLREEFAPCHPELPQVAVKIPATSSYDALLLGEAVPA